MILENEIRNSCLRLLSRREHSKLELRHKLVKRDFARSEIDSVIAELEQSGLQSDHRFTEQYFLSRVSKGFGPLRIKCELQEKGIMDPSMDQLIQGIDGGWESVIRQVFGKKYRGVPVKNHTALLKRFRFLSQRGFKTEQINKLIDEMGQLNNNNA